MVIGVGHGHTGQVKLLSAQPLYWHRTRRSEFVLTPHGTSAICLSWIRQPRDMTAKFAEHTLYICLRVHVTVSASILRCGKHSAHFVQWSTTLKMYIFPRFDHTWGPLRSIELPGGRHQRKWFAVVLYVKAFYGNNNCDNGSIACKSDEHPLASPVTRIFYLAAEWYEQDPPTWLPVKPSCTRLITQLNRR